MTTDPVTDYARQVVAGQIIAGPIVRGACARHMRDLKRADLVWDLAAARRILDFFWEVCRLAGGQFEGSPFKLEPWQAFIVGSIFGWKRKDGRRRYRTAYVETAKGSGKSPLAAGIGHYMLTSDGEARPEIYAAATKKDQAMVLFRDAVAMFQQSPELRKRLTPSGGNFKTIWQLTYLTKAGWFKPISNDDGQSGPRPYCALIDELHEHRDESTVEMLEAGFKFRTNPLLFMITNSGSDLTSTCGKYHELAVKVCSGEVEDDEFFAYVCGLDEGEDPFEDEACWVKANPSLGVTIQPAYLRSRINRARNLPDKRNEVLRLNFCVWTDAEAAWMTRDVWMKVQADGKEGHPPAFTLEDLRQRRAWLGLDMAIRNDLNALAVVVEDGFTDPRPATDTEPARPALPRFAAWAEFWLPKEKLAKKEEEDGKPYRRWVDEGHLRLSEGNFVRQEFLAQRLVEIGNLVDVQQIAYDEYGVKWLVTELDRLGAKLPLIEHPQGFRRGKLPDANKRTTDGKPLPPGLWMPSSIGAAEELIIDERIRVLPSPILTWNIASATFEKDAQGNRTLSKRKATGKIDGAVALVMASGAALNAPPPKSGQSYLETGEMVFG